MKREEKNQLSRQKILESAVREFGGKGYGLSSINTICSEGGISKGILYHYFKDKDEVYLACVGECFDRLTKRIRAAVTEKESGIDAGLQRYFDARVTFFRENPLWQNIFCDAVVSPPPHLAARIREMRAEFDNLNLTILTSLLQGVKLRKDTTLEDVVEVFRLYQDFVSSWYQIKAKDQGDPGGYEKICRKSVSILLYGVVEREGGCL